MKRIVKLFTFIFFILTFFLLSIPTDASSYMADKTEIIHKLEVSGAEALCQTDDGFFWIGQYSGLTRYDSKDYMTFKSFKDDDGNEYSLANIKDLTQINNILFIATANNLFMYKDYKFTRIDLNIDNIIINEIAVTDNYLYAATGNGLIEYDYMNNTHSFKTASNVNDIDISNDGYYYQIGGHIYDNNNNLIYTNDEILDIYFANNILYIAQLNGEIHRYDETTKSFKDTYVVQYSVKNADNSVSLFNESINKLLLSTANNILFVAGDHQLFYIDETDGSTVEASSLDNHEQLVDLFEDYEGNLWIASHKSGVSMITKNSLIDLLFDVDDSVMPPDARGIYATEIHDDMLYIASQSGIYVYDLKKGSIVENHSLTLETSGMSVRDIELFKDKLYFAVYKGGIVSYDLKTKEINHMGSDILDPKGESSYELNCRCLRAFDDFLLIGFSAGFIKFDGEKATAMVQPTLSGTTTFVLYIYNDNGRILFVYNKKGIYTINNNLELGSIKAIGNESNPSYAGMLKFMIDGDRLYYNLNERLFYLENGKVNEVTIPYASGSITELAKIKDGYVVATETQVYIIKDLKAENLEYQMFDSSNGLKADIAANTSGCYDEKNDLYYFVSKNGIYVYDKEVVDDKKSVPVKLAVHAINAGGNTYFPLGNEITLDKNVERLVFNYSVLAFKPNKGYSVYYKLEGVDQNFILATNDSNTIDYTNLSGGKYTLHMYVLDQFGEKSNEVSITLVKEKHFYETAWFWIIIIILVLALTGFLNFLIISNRAKKAKKREAELKGITIESIEAIARTIDVKDTYTNGHSIRVGHFSRIIAQELGMEGAELENLYYIALLHDIGKIGIPDAILNKPGKLTDEEFEIMKSHTTKGAKILKDISTIPNIVEGAKYHHEKYGGGGYPEGLKGEDIPYIARSICCADCYDAMATRRVYKEPYPKEKIISEFERCKGIQFDPNIADVVIKLINEGKLMPE